MLRVCEDAAARESAFGENPSETLVPFRSKSQRAADPACDGVVTGIQIKARSGDIAP